MKMQEMGSYDREWINLLLNARNLGISIEEIRQFFQEKVNEIKVPEG